ncbi:PEP-CTERM sorting domain-containing protein [Massilia sp. METH4]|uniref:PEP-CTERM sorting domain-containing protein n=1 Tax=Massilia sp. METH4 TaxID=3123041 RepID=UPI0030D607DE
MSVLRKFVITALAMASAAFSLQAHAEVGYADVVLDYHDSGAGPIAGPYGGIGAFTGYSPVTTDVVLGSEPGSIGYGDFLSLPTGSYVTVGFTDETAIDGVGDDIFIQETGASGERANVYVSSDTINFVLLGVAADDETTAFDLASIGFTDPVRAIKIVGLDSLGASPGFDVVNVQVLPGSVAPPVPEPETIGMLLAGLGVISVVARRRKQANK